MVGECICGRSDCVISMYKRFSKQQAKAEMGSLVTMATGQSSPLDRYPSTSFQVCISPRPPVSDTRWMDELHTAFVFFY